MTSITLDATSSTATTAALPPAPKRRRSRQTGIYIALTVLATIGLLPYLFVFGTSLKSNEQFAKDYWLPSWPLHLENYGTAWGQIQPYMITSLVVAAASIVGIVALSLLAGFVLARFEFPGRTFFFTLVIALMMVPGIASLIPLFVMMRDLGMLNTIWVLIIPHIAAGSVLGTILMKTFIEGIPQEIFDAARIDGAGTARLFRSIMMPLSLPVIGTVSLITVIGVWNDFFWPLLTITQNELKTVSVGLIFFQGQAGTDYGPMFAGYLLASLPLLLLFTFLSKYFLAGVQGGLPGSH
ncbi:ABC-type glycerol-3-phosphate transport system permease component [Kribbella aluminosa]|uniref:ABC-type glycerol-3-phosphate transport system permease component n=1 Tax=Kribbella aluminosa TaxID=416017 RepID=A0ABS4UWD2_9ACTN|nr:carbohydrate ABC transporter permease [Kribbella aluminosa]MBP2355937.1 ABC-type glycerol-3-phosphate transport system permease component [Kribbella aluminosa]